MIPEANEPGGGKTRAVLLVLGLLSLVLALFSHLLPPRAYAASILLIDYEFGFVRRGLVGTMLNPFFGDSVTLAEAHRASFAITLVGALALFATIYLRFRGSVAGLLLVILFASSFAYRGFIGASGYLDGVLVVLALAALAVPGAGWAAVAARCTLCAVGMLVHENMMPYFAVLLALDIWMADARGPVLSRMLRASLPVVTAVAVFAVFLGYGELSGAKAEAFHAYLNQKHRFAGDMTDFAVFAQSLTQQNEAIAGFRGSATYRYMLWFDGGPLGLMSLFLIWLNLRILPEGENGMTHIFLAGAILAPLSLNFVAYDVVRFGAMSVICGFLCLGLQVRYRAGTMDRLRAMLPPVMLVLVIVINLNVTALQINNASGHENQFPWVVLSHTQWSF